jgi:hypothetical protein
MEWMAVTDGGLYVLGWFESEAEALTCAVTYFLRHNDEVEVFAVETIATFTPNPQVEG